MIPVLAILTQFRVPIMIGMAASVLYGGVLYVRHLQFDLDVAKAAITVMADRAKVAEGQAAANADSAAIADRGARRDDVSITLHEAHDHVLQAAPGASTPVDPALNAAGRRGLCGYAAYAADPECAGLRGSDPAVLPPAGPGDAATAN